MGKKDEHVHDNRGQRITEDKEGKDTVRVTEVTYCVGCNTEVNRKSWTEKR